MLHIKLGPFSNGMNLYLKFVLSHGNFSFVLILKTDLSTLLNIVVIQISSYIVFEKKNVSWVINQWLIIYYHDLLKYFISLLYLKEGPSSI